MFCRSFFTCVVEVFTVSLLRLGLRNEGWAMQDIMQWATAYAMPFALGVTKTFSDEVSMVKDGRFVFYWYEFLDRGGEYGVLTGKEMNIAAKNGK